VNDSQSISRRMTAAAACVLAVAACMITSCTKSLNNDVPLIRGEPATVDPEEAKPSFDGLSRNHWREVETSWVAGTVRHQPTYVENLRIAADSPRERGAYPSVDTVAGDDRDDLAQAAQGALAPPHAAWLLVRAPLLMIFDGQWPWSTASSPDDDYEQLPTAGDGPSERWRGVTPVDVDAMRQSKSGPRQ